MIDQIQDKTDNVETLVDPRGYTQEDDRDIGNKWGVRQSWM